MRLIKLTSIHSSADDRLVLVIGTGNKSNNNKSQATATSSTRQATTTKPATTAKCATTTSATTTTTSDGATSIRCHDTNVRRWLHHTANALAESSHASATDRSATDRSRRPSRCHQAVLSHRPSSSVLDAIRAIEARQLPPSGPTTSGLSSCQNTHCSSAAFIGIFSISAVNYFNKINILITLH